MDIFQEQIYVEETQKNCRTVKNQPAQPKTNQSEIPSGLFPAETLQMFQQENQIQELGYLNESSQFDIDLNIQRKLQEMSQSQYDFYQKGQNIGYNSRQIDQNKQQPRQNQVYPQQSTTKKERKNSTNPNKKNNQPKFIMRIFCQNVKEQAATYAGYGDIFQRVREKAMNLYAWMIEDKKHHISLKHLQSFFGNKTDSIEESLLNRIALRRILKGELKKEVIQNRQLKKKLHYLQAAKVYLLRCSSQSLSSRIQCQ